VPHFQNAPTGFAHDRKGFWKKTIQSLSVGQSLLEFAGFLRKFTIGKLRNGAFQVRDLLNERLGSLQVPFIFAAKDFFEDSIDNQR